jgi:hypothetical protein
MKVDRESITAVPAAFLEMSQQPLRVVQSLAGGDAFVTYDIVVPRELTRLVVLDASWPIRELEQLDTGILADASFGGRVKSYRNVKLRLLKIAAGRGAVEDSLSAQRAEDRLYVREVVNLVTNVIPENERVLIFCHKQQTKRSLDIPGILREAFDAAGVSRDRVAIETWGMETGLNDYSHVENVVLFGLLYRSQEDIAASIIGQSGDITKMFTQEDVQRIIRSECAHTAYQALSRGRCRVTVNGDAQPMRGWLIDRDNTLLSYLAYAMPDVDLSESWDAQYVSPIAQERLAEKTADTIVAYMAGLSPDVRKISVKALRRALWTGDNVKEDTLTRATDLALLQLPDWMRSGRSLVRQ